jgi:hypothetical protein
MNTIVNPITQIPYSIFSENGKKLLKSYILLFQSGGSDNSENNRSESTEFNEEKWIKKWVSKGVPEEELKHYLNTEKNLVAKVKNKYGARLKKPKCPALITDQIPNIRKMCRERYPMSWLQQNEPVQYKQLVEQKAAEEALAAQNES